MQNTKTFLEKRLKKFSLEKYKKIFDREILVIGAGGVGSFLCEILIREGFKKLTIVDGDIVDKTNLNRQNYLPKDVGKFKTKTLYKKLKKINQNSHIETFNFFLDGNTYKKVFTQKFNLVIDCSDNIKTRFLVNGLSKKFKFDWIYNGAIRDESVCYLFKHKENNFSKIFKDENKFEKCSSEGVYMSTTLISSSYCFNKILNYFLEEDKKNNFIKFIGLEESFFKLKFN